MGFPPPEFRVDTERAMGQADLFGLGLQPTQLQRMAEREADDHRIMVMIADIHLDKVRALVSEWCTATGHFATAVKFFARLWPK
jgi:hypothetical protein